MTLLLPMKKVLLLSSIIVISLLFITRNQAFATSGEVVVSLEQEDTNDYLITLNPTVRANVSGFQIQLNADSEIIFTPDENLSQTNLRTVRNSPTQRGLMLIFALGDPSNPAVLDGEVIIGKVTSSNTSEASIEIEKSNTYVVGTKNENLTLFDNDIVLEEIVNNNLETNNQNTETDQELVEEVNQFSNPTIAEDQSNLSNSIVYIIAGMASLLVIFILIFLYLSN